MEEVYTEIKFLSRSESFGVDITSGSSSLRSLTLSGKLLIGVETDAIYCSRLNKSDSMMFLLVMYQHFQVASC